MICSNCGNELEDDVNFCSKCGKKINEPNNTNSNNNGKVRFKVADAVNLESVKKSTNKVAYIANGWALKIKDNGTFFAMLIAIVYFFIALSATSGSNGGVWEFFSVMGIGLLYAFIIIVCFNTTAFIIRMGGEIIQLLEDIKNK